MDMSEYKKEFISEARDHADFLNEGLLILEKAPNDDENINKLFRSFHTLKGNGAAMGFMKFSELAHSLEDLLSKVRDKELSPSQELIDVLLSGIDFLEQGLDLIDKDDSESLNPESVIINVKKLMNCDVEESKVTIESVLSLSDEDKKNIEASKANGESIHRVIIGFDSGNILKTAKALLILRDLSNQGKILKSNPAQDDIKQGKFSSHVDLIISIKADKDHVFSIVNKISGIKELNILGLDEKFESHLANEVSPNLNVQNIAQVDSTKSESSISATSIQTSSSQNSPSTQGLASSNQVSTHASHTESVKVDMRSLDSLMNLVGELLISNIRLKDIDTKKEYDQLKTVLTGIDRLIMDLKEEVMDVRMLPIGNIFNRYPRMVRDLAAKQNKKINFVLEGQEIKFDRTVLDEIGDPLIHLLRNSVDHGIESPDDRLNQGKGDTGLIKLVARRDKNSAVIEIIDDGAGIDAQKVKLSSIKKGLLKPDEAEKMSEKDLQMLIFRPGTSTNEVITEVSGRGVGMDVVLTKVTALGGTASLDSKVGRGTVIKLELPLTVAIIMSFLIRIKNEVYAIPLVNVEENIDIKLSQIKTIRGNKVFLLRGVEIPIFWLEELTGLQNKNDNLNENKLLTVVIVNRGSEKVGLVVDEILSQQQILIKALQPCIKNTKGFSGVTILGDGGVALIIDVNTIL